MDHGLPSADQLMRKATAYLARQAASSARVRAFLGRAVARAAGEAAPESGATAALVEPVIARLQRAGLLDDAAFAGAKARRLIAKGKPAAAIRAELRYRDGVEPADEAFEHTLAALDAATQAWRWAERRRLGPFRARDRAAKRGADIASLVRAGFDVGVAETVIDRDAGVPPERPTGLL